MKELAVIQPSDQSIRQESATHGQGCRCGLCCVIYNPGSLKQKTVCQNLTANAENETHCTIYNERPLECRQFNCTGQYERLAGHFDQVVVLDALRGVLVHPAGEDEADEEIFTVWASTEQAVLDSYRLGLLEHSQSFRALREAREVTPAIFPVLAAIVEPRDLTTRRLPSRDALETLGVTDFLQGLTPDEVGKFVELSALFAANAPLAPEVEESRWIPTRNIVEVGRRVNPQFETGLNAYHAGQTFTTIGELREIMGNTEFVVPQPSIALGEIISSGRI